MVLSDIGRARRTVVFQKDNGTTPIDHPIDGGLEKIEKPHIDKRLVFKVAQVPSVASGLSELDT